MVVMHLQVKKNEDGVFVYEEIVPGATSVSVTFPGAEKPVKISSLNIEACVKGRWIFNNSVLFFKKPVSRPFVSLSKFNQLWHKLGVSSPH